MHINPVMNKRFLIKDSVFYYDDRKYRIEIAIDVDSEVVCQTPYYYARSESILNGCLQPGLFGCQSGGGSGTDPLLCGTDFQL